MRRPGVLAAVLVGLLAGCAAPVSGTPAPEPSVAPAPTRPRDVPVDGVDPCSLLTEADRAALGLDRSAVPNALASGFWGADALPACSFGGFEPAVSTRVALPVTGGIEQFTDRDVPVELTPLTVGEFPAIRAVPDAFTDFCIVVVDVADGQALDVLFRNGGEDPPIPQPELCASAQDVAERALANLLARR